MSSTLEDPDRDNSTVLTGDVVDVVTKRRQELIGEIVVLGSPQLARTLIAHDLVDELRLMIYPVVLGTCARLFGETSDKKPMRLLDTETVDDGIAILTYAAVADVERASDGTRLQDKRAAALRRAGTQEGASAGRAVHRETQADAGLPDMVLRPSRLHALAVMEANAESAAEAPSSDRSRRGAARELLEARRRRQRLRENGPAGAPISDAARSRAAGIGRGGVAGRQAADRAPRCRGVGPDETSCAFGAEAERIGSET